MSVDLLEKVKKSELKVTTCNTRSSHTHSTPKSFTPFKKKRLSYDYEKSFVENNLIAYIGNKKRLLQLIIAAIEQVETTGSTPINREGYFLDLFSGTGVVARLAKSLGFSVKANDWEYYSYCINCGFLEMTPNDLKLFDDEGGVEKVLDELNKLHKENHALSYIARYYCPKNDLNPDAESERIYYTRKNGILIDNIRQEIENRYPTENEINKKKKKFLLALLLIQASKRSNTSGVFKAFHHGFGGTKGDALSRIMAPIKLELPDLSKAKKEVEIFCADAFEVAKQLKGEIAEIAYLDPPYNQHQYGSNYHLLNTIAKNDKPEVKESFWIDGKKKDKGAIRKDWKETSSPFCSQKTAVKEFSKLIKAINAKYMMVSYSDEGIIGLDEMIDILSKRGKVSITTSSYIRYRGGRQANSTVNKNVEFILIVETALSSTAEDVEEVKSTLFSNTLELIMEDYFPIFQFSGSEVIRIDGEKNEVNFKVFWRKLGLELVLDSQLHLKESSKKIIRQLPVVKQRLFYQELQLLRPQTNHEKVLDIIGLLENRDIVNRRYFLNELVRCYNKVNKKKEPILFEELTEKIVKLNDERGWLREYQSVWKQFCRIKSTESI